MVRHTESEGTRFQYQKGAIKTELVLAVADRAVHDFNTKKVRLKQRRSGLISTFTNFNTKKVRLKQRLFLNLIRALQVFQYQKGAIKTPDGQYRLHICAAISIPKRCD